MKTFEVFKNGTQQGELKAKNLKEAQDIVFATYGEKREVYEQEDEGTDLFETPELLPDHIKAILDSFDCESLSYSDCETMLAQMEKLGYTFEFGLDAVPFNLCEIENVIAYHRQPTAAEIKFGYGATHYKDFPLSQCTKKDGNYKKWLICPVDGLRYYY